MTTRRGFFGLLAGFAMAPRATWRDLWPPADLSFRNFHLPTELAKTAFCRPLPEGTPQPIHLVAVIGQWADYYAEHDGMIETGPGCRERLDARIAALPPGDPGKVDRILRRLETGEDQQA
jgi:hypothetical protein